MWMGMAYVIRRPKNKGTYLVVGSLHVIGIIVIHGGRLVRWMGKNEVKGQLKVLRKEMGNVAAR